MLTFGLRHGLPIHVLLTKSDKLGRGQAARVQAQVSRAMDDLPGVSLQRFSAVDGTGIDAARAKLLEWLQRDDGGTSGDQ
jgi:GTP-binding protein